MSGGVFVTGTDTGVGKTFVTAGLCRALRRRGVDVAAMKPVETGWDGPEAEWPPDAGLLAAAAAAGEGRAAVVPVFFPEPLAPLVAARRCGTAVDVAGLVAAHRDLARRHGAVVVEGAGGLAVPVTQRHTMADLAAAMGVPLLLVARPGLGTLNHVALTAAYAAARGLRLLGVVLNGYECGQEDVATETNPWVIEQVLGLPVLARLPRLADGWGPDEAADLVGPALDSPILAEALGLGG